MAWEDDILLNVVAEIIGVVLSLIVVYLFIEKYYEKKERLRWEKIEKRVYRIIISSTYNYLDGAYYVIHKDKTKRFEKPETSKNYTNQLGDPLKWSIKQWEFQKNILKTLRDELDKVINIHQERIQPEILNDIFEIEQTLNRVYVVVNHLINIFEREKDNAEIELLREITTSDLSSLYKLIFELYSKLGLKDKEFIKEITTFLEL